MVSIHISNRVSINILDQVTMPQETTQNTPSNPGRTDDAMTQTVATRLLKDTSKLSVILDYFPEYAKTIGPASEAHTRWEQDPTDFVSARKYIRGLFVGVADSCELTQDPRFGLYRKSCLDCLSLLEEGKPEQA